LSPGRICGAEVFAMSAIALRRIREEMTTGRKPFYWMLYVQVLIAVAIGVLRA
jgi:hypothetical protein